jgi:hypothetical protein
LVSTCALLKNETIKSKNTSTYFTYYAPIALLNPLGQVLVHTKDATTGATAAPIAIPTPAGVAHNAAESKL